MIKENTDRELYDKVLKPIERIRITTSGIRSATKILVNWKNGYEQKHKSVEQLSSSGDAGIRWRFSRVVRVGSESRSNRQISWHV